jgi:hypothetical protein
MAEIRIEQKRRALGWLWLLLALIIVAILAWYFLYPGRTAPAPATGAPPTTGAARPSERGAPERLGLVGGGSPAYRVALRLDHSGGDNGEQG